MTKKKPAEVKIDFTDLASRLSEVPAPPGNYGALQATDKRLCWLNASDDRSEHLALQCLDIANKGDEVGTVLADVKGYEISLDRKKIAGAARAMISTFSIPMLRLPALAIRRLCQRRHINLSHWTIVTPIRARSFAASFSMHGGWSATISTIATCRASTGSPCATAICPLVDRVADRDELNEVIAQMVSEFPRCTPSSMAEIERKPADEVDHRHAGRASCAATKRPAATWWSTSISTIPIFPIRLLRSPGPNRWSRKATRSQHRRPEPAERHRRARAAARQGRPAGDAARQTRHRRERAMCW